MFKGPDLEKALRESLKLFEGPGARPSAKKVLVVIMDKKSGVSESLIKDASSGLHKGNIRVIPVAVGNEVDKKELETSTEDKSNLIEAPKDLKPDKLGETIMRKVLKGNLTFVIYIVMHTAVYVVCMEIIIEIVV